MNKDKINDLFEVKENITDYESLQQRRREGYVLEPYWCKRCEGSIYYEMKGSPLSTNYFCSECGIESKDVDSIGYEDEGE